MRIWEVSIGTLHSYSTMRVEAAKLLVDPEDYMFGNEEGEFVFVAPRGSVVFCRVVSDSGQAEKLPEVDGGV